MLFKSITGDFNALFPYFLDVILVYEDSASEIISGVKFSYRPPMKHDIDEDGECLYPVRYLIRGISLSLVFLLHL